MRHEEREVLDSLSVHPDEWHRPMDVGGYDASHHSRTLRRLCKRGLVERVEYTRFIRPTYRYRITEVGLAVLGRATHPTTRSESDG